MPTFNKLLRKQLTKFKRTLDSRVPWTYHMFKKYADEVGDQEFTSAVNFHLRSYSRTAQDVPWTKELFRKLSPKAKDDLLATINLILRKYPNNTSGIPWSYDMIKRSVDDLESFLPFPTITPLANQLDTDEFLRLTTFSPNGWGSYNVNDFQLTNDNGSNSSTTYSVDWGDGVVETGYNVGDKVNHAYTNDNVTHVAKFTWETPADEKPDSLILGVTGTWANTVLRKLELYYPDLKDINFNALGNSPISWDKEVWMYGSYPNFTIGDPGYVSYSNISYHSGIYAPNCLYPNAFFRDCEHLIEVGPMYLPAAQGYSSFFRGCTSLETIVAIEMNETPVKTFGGLMPFFNGCAALTSIRLKNAFQTIDFQDCTSLSGEAINQIFTDLGVNAYPGTSDNVVIPFTATGEDASIAEAKGWTVLKL